MEKYVVSDYIKNFVLNNFDNIEGLSGDRSEEFIEKFNEVIDKNEDEIYFRMLEIKDKKTKEMDDLEIKCNEENFEDILNDYSAIFLISKKYFYIAYVGIFKDADLDYPKFDKETYSQFSSGVYIPFEK
ncbi:hypothetical protein [Methanobacterium spitsbergense]|uniref:Uncharacterized protein n=1 Tax=Methanobacterium spitsbergense TaxID=2874285 RepID=A0A8T5UX78_9EURY|nr:hypothetical protein [Methanobacterium spitsbergense]MBZ2165433.1 hypothetical protein [Methanobacterium spitsbergense]